MLLGDLSHVRHCLLGIPVPLKQSADGTSLLALESLPTLLVQDWLCSFTKPVSCTRLLQNPAALPSQGVQSTHLERPSLHISPLLAQLVTDCCTVQL